MKPFVLSLLLALTWATTIRAQGMTPNYVYLHEALVYPGSGSSGGSVIFRETISGDTDCPGTACVGVYHTPYDLPPF